MDLAPSGNVGYGLRIIADNGNWQWSNAFGVSNPGYTGGSVAPTAYEAPKTTSASVTPLSEASDGQVLAPTAKVTSLPITNSAASSAIAYYTSTSTASASSSASVSQQVSNITSPTSIYYSATLPHYHHNNNNTTRASYAQSNASGKLPVVLSIGIVASSGSSVSESVKPTGTMSVPSTLSPISRTSVAAGGTATSLTATGAAGRAVVGGVVAGLGAVAALVL